tara:strand:+ start:646 stop:1971 length:1326 start_codon:yes stop_codon:yes gene_type:complete
MVDFRDVAAELASGFNQMRLRPDPGLDTRLQTIRQQRTAKRAKNKTIEYLRDLGTPDALQMADMIETGALKADQGLSTILQQQMQMRQADTKFQREKELALFEAGLDSLKGPDFDTADYKNFQALKLEDPTLTFDNFLRMKKGIQSKGVYKNRETGDIIGEVNFDPVDGTYFQHNPDTQEREIIDITAHSPVTDATFAKTIPNFAQFTKNFEQINTDMASLRRLKQYMTTVKDKNEGILLLADDFTRSAKTLLGGFLKNVMGIDKDFLELTPAEIKAAVARGQQQGLIGRFRIETVGGGVMTEQDALRIIMNLGGDVNAFQNKKIVAEQISKLYQDKVGAVNRGVGVHNNAVKQIYGESGYEPVELVEYNPEDFEISSSVLTKPKKSLPVGGDRKLSDDDLRAIITTAMQSGAAADLSNVFGPDLARYQEILSEMISQPVD